MAYRLRSFVSLAPLLILVGCSTPPNPSGTDASVLDANGSRERGRGPDIRPPRVDAAPPNDGPPVDAGPPIDAPPIDAPPPPPPPVLAAVDPSSGAVSTGASVTLSGSYFGSDIKSIDVGGVSAVDIVYVDSMTIRARFLPVTVAERGQKDVTIRFADGRVATQSKAFEYFFEQDPIVFLHGCPFPPDTNAGTASGWSYLQNFFLARGYPPEWLHVFVLSEQAGNCGSNARYAEELAAFIEEVRAATGAPRVDLVAHSVGGFAGRLYIARGGAPEVRDFLSLAGAHHGTDALLVSNASPTPPDYDGAKELAPSYACDGQAPGNLQFELNGCLDPVLGRTVARDETPYGIEDGSWIAYKSIYCFEDEIIVPRQSSCLNQATRNDCSDPINVEVNLVNSAGCHVSTRRDASVHEMVWKHVTARNRIAN